MEYTDTGKVIIFKPKNAVDIHDCNKYLLHMYSSDTTVKGMRHILYDLSEIDRVSKSIIFKIYRAVVAIHGTGKCLIVVKEDVAGKAKIAVSNLNKDHIEIFSSVKSSLRGVR